MEPFFTLAKTFSPNAQHTRAYSAMPDAPVLPYTAPRARTLRPVVSLRRFVRRPLVEVRRPSYSAGCTSP
jgi:hypothetical protein